MQWPLLGRGAAQEVALATAAVALDRCDDHAAREAFAAVDRYHGPGWRSAVVQQIAEAPGAGDRGRIRALLQPGAPPVPASLRVLARRLAAS